MPIQSSSSTLGSLHVQLWMRMNTTVGRFRFQESDSGTYSADVFQMKSMRGEKKPILQIRIVKGVLECELNGEGQNFKSQKITYRDFSVINPKWQHVSCWFEGYDVKAEATKSTDGNGRVDDELTKKNILLGSLYYDEQTFNYYYDHSNWLLNYTSSQIKNDYYNA